MPRPVRTAHLPTPPASCRRRAFMGAGLALPWLGSGCAPQRPLQLAGHPWPGYEPMFLARSLDYLPANIELYESATVQESIEALGRERVDGAMLTLDEALRLRDQGLSLEIVLVFNVSRGADMLLARPPIHHLSGLRGKRLGVEDTVLGSLMLTLVLEKAGLRHEDVTVQRIAYESHEKAWQRGDVDALITYEPAGGRLAALGARRLLSTRQLPDTIFDVLVMHREAARRHADRLRAGLSGYFRALAYMRQNPWDAAYRVAPRLQLSAQGMIDTLRGLELPDIVGNRRYLAADGTLLQSALRLSPILQQAGQLQRPVDPQRLVNNAYLPAA